MPTDGSIRRTGERSSSSTGKSERRSPAEPPGLRSGDKRDETGESEPPSFDAEPNGAGKGTKTSRPNSGSSASERTESPVPPNETYHHDTDKTHPLDLLVRMARRTARRRDGRPRPAPLGEENEPGAVCPTLLNHCKEFLFHCCNIALFSFPFFFSSVLYSSLFSYKYTK